MSRAHAVAVALLLAALAAFSAEYDWNLRRSPVDPRWDPEVVYLMNSLLVFTGRSYAFVDHPGTPVEVIGTALLALTWPFVGGPRESFTEYHVRNPMVGLTMTHVLLTAASLLVVALLAWKAIPLARWDDGLMALAVAGSFYAFHPDAPNSLVYWSHNSFNFPAGCLLTLLTFLRLRENRPLDHRWTICMGLAAGALAAVQLYFVAWIAGLCVTVTAAVLLRGRGGGAALRAAALVAGAGAAGFVVATLPIATRYGQLARFVGALVSHQGLYGSGDAGVPSPQRLLANAYAIAQVTPALFLALGLALLAVGVAAFLERSRLQARSGLWATALGLAIQAAALAVAVAKHPQVLYTQSLAATLPVLMAVAFTLWRSRGWWARLACVITSGAVLAGVVDTFASTRGWNLSVFSTVETSLRDMTALLERADASGPPRAGLTVWTYGTDAPCVALWIANHYAEDAFTNEVSRQCPADAAYWGERLMAPVRWPRQTAGSARGRLVTVGAVLRSDAALAGLGTPRHTRILSLNHDEYFVIGIDLDRLRGGKLPVTGTR